MRPHPHLSNWFRYHTTIGSDVSSTDGTVAPDGGDGTRTPSWWLRVVLSSALAPIVIFFIASLVLLMAGGLDPASTFNVSDEVLGGILIGASGLVSGVIVGLFGGLRGWRLAAPAIAGGAVGLAVFGPFWHSQSVASQPKLLVQGSGASGSARRLASFLLPG